MKLSVTILFLLALFACNNKENPKIHLPSQVYHYVKIDTAVLANKHSVYVPVYSHIYAEAGTSVISLTATLSIRNISYSDSFYVTDVIYYDSQGEVLKRYLNSSVLVKPMTSIEFVVQRTDSRGGAGANFVVKWGAPTIGSEPLIQIVMNGTSTGISLITNGVEMK